MVCVQHVHGGISICQVDKTKPKGGVSGNMGAFVFLEDDQEVKDEV